MSTLASTSRVVWTIHRATYLEIARHPAFYLLTLAAAALIFASQKLTFFGFYSESNMVREMGISTVLLWGILACILLSHHILHAELENRSATTLLAKPVTRTAYLLGKYLGLLRALLLGGLLLTLVLILTLWTFEGLPKLAKAGARASTSLVHFATDTSAWSALEGPLGALGGIAPGAAAKTVSLTPQEVIWTYFRQEFLAHDVWPVLVGGLLALAHAALVASFSVGLAAYFPPVVVANGTVAVYLIGHLTDYLASALSSFDATAHAGGVLSAAGRILQWVLPNLEPFNPSDHLARGDSVSAIYVALVMAYAIVYVSAVLGTTAFAFSRRELP